MRQVLLLIAVCLFTLSSFAQDRKDLAVSFTAGYFNSPYYKNARSRGYFGLGFDYYLAKRHVLAASYVAGGHNYFDDVLSNTPASAFIMVPGNTNAQADYNTFAIVYKYKLVNGERITVAPGAGAGVLTLSRQYPYSTSNSLRFEQSSWSDLVFPVTLDVNLKLSQHWQAGVMSGFIIHPDYPLLGLQAGPRLTYVIK